METEHTSATHLQWLTEIRANGCPLTDWENDFLSSIDFALSRGMRITRKQEWHLERVHTKATANDDGSRDLTP